MKASALTHIGLKRKKNEDRYLIKKISDELLLLAVADGLGGEAAGYMAAEIIINQISAIDDFPGDFERLLATVVEQTDNRIYQKAKTDPSLRGMGSTFTCVIINNDYVHWVHAGDSRLYLLRNNVLTQITKDDNMTCFLVEEGEITEEEALSHPGKNFLFQCVGSGDCEPQTGCIKIEKNDLLLLTTDGIHGFLSKEYLTSVLCLQTAIKSKLQQLVHAAIDAGGSDNITVLIAEKS